jgi:rubrerythrin
MNSVDEILDFAIDREQEASDFYAGLSGRATSPWLRGVLDDFSKEELRHKGKLLSVKKGEKLLSPDQPVMDLKISDYLVEVEAGPDISFQDALIVAMKREKAAYRLYSDLAGKVQDAEIKALFEGLAQEEAKHKLYFETQYDEQVLKDN